MSEIFYRTPREAAALIRPGSIKSVRLLFQARSNHVALVKVPKVRVKQMLHQLPDNAVVGIEIMHGFAEATIAGLIGPLRATDPVQVSEAASVARRLT